MAAIDPALQTALSSLDDWDGKNVEALQSVVATFSSAAIKSATVVEPSDLQADLALYTRATAAGSRAMARLISSVRTAEVDGDEARAETLRALGRSLQGSMALFAKEGSRRLRP